VALIGWFRSFPASILTLLERTKAGFSAEQSNGHRHIEHQPDFARERADLSPERSGR
jgi:hypothetical protein